MTGEWGEDPSKWVIQKSSASQGWSVFPPHDGEAWTHPTFDEARQVVISFMTLADVLHLKAKALDQGGDL